MNLGYSFFLNLCQNVNQKPSDYAGRLGVSQQAIHSWKASGKIPSRRISDIADMFDLGPSDVERLMGKVPLQFEFRTKKGEHLSANEVTDRMKVRSEVIYERLFKTNKVECPHNLSSLRKKVEDAGKDFLEIAKLIREEFTIPDYAPILRGDVRRILTRICVEAFYMPFEKLRLNVEGESEQTAILYKKNDKYTMLIDSERTLDEAHFDCLHELCHVFFEGVFQQTQELEDLIDKVCGELIYPKKYVVERFFGGDPASKPVKDKKKLKNTFYEEAIKADFEVSPKGLAYSMRDTGLASVNSELYKTLISDMHSNYRQELGITYSEMGKLDFDFKNRDALADFYNKIVEDKLSKGHYPLFEKLKSDLVSDKLGARAFADTFGLPPADAIVLKALWQRKDN